MPKRKSSFTITWQHIRRTPYQALAAGLVMILTFFIASVFALVTWGSEKMLRYFETRPQVTTFFADTATPEIIGQLKSQLENTGLTASIKFVSKEEALAIYQEQNKNDPLLLQMVTAQILPASLEVSAINIQAIPQLAAMMQEAQGVEDVVYQPDVVEALGRWTRAIRLSGIIIIGFFTLTSILIIIIITGMRIAARREEIDLLKLLGASNWYIQSPFLIEGMFYGLTGALVAWVAATILLLYSTPWLIDFFGSVPLLPVPLWAMASLLGAEMLFGAIIGSLGSLIALSRFMR